MIRIQAAVAAMIDYMAQNEIFEAAVVTHGGVIATLMSTLGLPRQPLQFWKTSGGRGFTCFVHPQILAKRPPDGGGGHSAARGGDRLR